MTERNVRGAIACLALAGLVGAAPACDDDSGGGGGGITIQSSDTTTPDVALDVALAGSTETASVDADGPARSFTLPNRTGTLNLAATAKDDQTGIQRIEIWMTTTKTDCDAADVCSITGPSLAGQPQFQSTEPAKSPGETTAASSIELETLPLTTAITGTAPPGGSLTVKLVLWAVAYNHLGQKSQTANVSVTWKG